MAKAVGDSLGLRTEAFLLLGDATYGVIAARTIVHRLVLGAAPRYTLAWVDLAAQPGLRAFGAVTEDGAEASGAATGGGGSGRGRLLPTSRLRPGVSSTAGAALRPERAR
jgi:hypothetical protein